MISFVACIRFSPRRRPLFGRHSIEAALVRWMEREMLLQPITKIELQF